MATLKRHFLDEATALSSSPAFGTPVHPIQPAQARNIPPPAFKPSIPTVLPILLPPPTLRPLAFRTFTKKYNLTLGTTALQALASFIGRHCGSGWREEGTGERVLEEVAKLWKAETGPVIVEDGSQLKGILKVLEGCMSGGKVGPVKSGPNSRQNSFAFGQDSDTDHVNDGRPSLERQGSSFGMSGLAVNGANGPVQEDSSDDDSNDPRSWLKVISAFAQPRLSYDADRKHYVQISSKPSLFPSPSHQIAFFKQRYNIILQRLLRNEAFQAPTISVAPARLKRQDTATMQQFYKITPIANLLGRGGTNHLLLGQLAISPAGTLALHDLSGSIPLDLQHAVPLQGKDSAYFCPGMIVLVDGVYEEDWAGAGGSGLGNTGGVGGSIGGRFVGFSIGGPPVERRHISLGVDTIDASRSSVGGGFGWTDFLGLGSERAVGERMQRLENRLLGTESAIYSEGSHRGKMIVLGEVTLDQPATMAALRKIFTTYSTSLSTNSVLAPQVPISFLLVGNFSSQPSLAGSSVGSIEYKDLFNELAAMLAEYPSLLKHSTFIFVPGDNDPWVSSSTAGASALIPREPVPNLFTSRIRRAFANAKTEVRRQDEDAEGSEAIWTSNPARVSLFGPRHEVVVLRDDLHGRMRRNAIRVGQATQQQSDDAEALPHQSSDSDINMSDALPTDEGSPEDASTSIDSATPLENSEALQARLAKKLILSLLPQSTLSPFPLQTRPVHWDYGPSALSLFPLPNTLVLVDTEMEPYALTYEGCHVLNPGKLVDRSRKGTKIRWAEYDFRTKRGDTKEEWL
ncbi:hypothetical protein K431DRAFT_285236, partial [Polychaeton citri CBS 116435]